jgi:hypothetical protein
MSKNRQKQINGILNFWQDNQQSVVATRSNPNPGTEKTEGQTIIYRFRMVILYEKLRKNMEHLFRRLLIQTNICISDKN